MKRQSIPGVAVAVQQSGRIVYAKGFGFASAEPGGAAAVTPATLFRLGSTSKVATASAIVEAGLDVQKPVSAYAPALPPHLARLTLRQLLTHTAGLRDNAPMDGPHDESALESNVLSWTQDAILAEPGEVFSYANPGYVLAGYVLQKATGKPFASAVADLLHLQTSTYRPFVAMTHPLALPHGPGGKVIRPFPDHAGAWPPGSLFSNAVEFVALVSRSFRALTSYTTSVDKETRYGYGVMVSTTDGAVFHTGGRAGYGSSYYCLPEAEVCAVILTNETAVAMRSFAERAARLVVGVEAPPAKPALPAEFEALSPDGAAKLCGRYYNSDAIQTELRIDAGKLQVRAAAMGWIPVTQSGRFEFRAAGAGPLDHFRISVDASGKPLFLHAEAWALRYGAGVHQ